METRHPDPHATVTSGADGAEISQDCGAVIGRNVRGAEGRTRMNRELAASTASSAHRGPTDLELARVGLIAAVAPRLVASVRGGRALSLPFSGLSPPTVINSTP